jgi:predicted phage terminase large subunit-like protein
MIRDAKEAYNDRRLDELWDYYNNTYQSRLEDAKEIVIMTRWGINDICGRLLETEPDEWHVIKLPANKMTPSDPKSNEDMLCPDILSYKRYMKRKLSVGTDEIIFSANYDQNPLEAKDRLYGEFKTYADRQEKYDRIEAYIDTADEGSDYLACIVVGAHHGILDVLDVYYTQEPMEITEGRTAKLLTDNAVSKVYVESNSGGRSFARAIERVMRENGNTKTYVSWFTQSANKMSRIQTNATAVCNCMIWPQGWKDKWPQVYQEFRAASRTRKMVHDDIYDCATGCVEKCLVNKYEVW